MIKGLFQFTLSTAIIFAYVSCKRKLSFEDGVQPRDMFFRMRRPGNQPSHDSKRENNQLTEKTCAPYPEVVQVEPDVTNLRNIPQFVTVNRCKGACKLSINLEACEAITVQNIAVNISNGYGQEYVRYVAHHVDCRCTCQVTCTAGIHIRHATKCKCVCKEKCKDGEAQNPETCECIAKRIQEIHELTEY